MVPKHIGASAISAIWVVLSLMLGGCGFLPTSGPLSREIGGDPSKTASDQYVVVDVDHAVIRAIGAVGPTGISRLQRTAMKAPKPRIGVGDVLAVTVFEAGDGGRSAAKMLYWPW